MNLTVMRRHVSFNQKEKERAYVQLLLLLQSIVHLACLFPFITADARLSASHLHGYSKILLFLYRCRRSVQRFFVVLF